MTKKRGYPDRRGMGAESDPTTEPFVPSETYKAQQMAIARKLIAAGLKPEDVAKMFFIPLELLSSEMSKKT
jgi:hypothetical protein